MLSLFAVVVVVFVVVAVVVVKNKNLKASGKKIVYFKARWEQLKQQKLKIIKKIMNLESFTSRSFVWLYLETDNTRKIYL